MKITKHAHSCLLVEDKGKVILIDPGNYSREEGTLDISKTEKLDYLLITHEHPDHMDIEWVKAIAGKFPDATVISNGSVKKILEKEGVPVETAGNSIVAVEKAGHERIVGREAPENVMFTVAGKLTHPGDSHSFTATAEVLALPVQAPWGSFVAAIELAEKLKPKTVIPIHDWHWNSKARELLYGMASEYLEQKGIEFKKIKNGKPVNV